MSNGHMIMLANGTELVGKFCSSSNLPLLTMSRGKLSYKPSAYNTFASTTTSNRNYWLATNVQDVENENMTAFAKEAQLWHCRLSHAGLNWIQLIMRPRPWLCDLDANAALYQDPFIPCTEACTHTIQCRHLKCAACKEAKGHIKPPESKRRKSSEQREKEKTDCRDIFTERLEGLS